MTAAVTVGVLSTLMVVLVWVVTRLSRRGSAVTAALAVWVTGVSAVAAAAAFSLVLMFATSTETWLGEDSPTPFGDLLAACHQTGAAVAGGGHPALTAAAVYLTGLAAVLRLLDVTVRHTRRIRRDRRRHFDAAHLTATSVSHLPGAVDTVAFIVPSTSCAAFCIPGQNAVVMTEAVVKQLSEAERLAVLAHEQAHLRERHHVLTDALALLRRAFPFVAVFRLADIHVRNLVEMRADDVAARRVGRGVVAAALEQLTSPASGAVVLAANDGTAIGARLSRLRSAPRVAHGTQTALAAAGTMLCVLPFIIATALHATLC